MENAPVLVEKTGYIAQITLNRPENRNSMNADLMAAFIEAVDEIKADRELRCLIITGSGKTFCAGADFSSNLDNPLFRLPNAGLLNMYEPFLKLQQISIPIIGALNGHAIGGGFGLALMCDIRVANKNAKYGANFARLGIHSGMAISYMLPRLIGLPRANELLFTGRLIDGVKSQALGLVNYAEAEEKVLSKARELAKEIAGCAPVAVSMIKHSVYRGLNWDVLAAAEWEAHCQSRTFEMEDAKEGINALLEKREPQFKGN
ncbi:enoyl-CoA hydratase/isomerase family protein [bacterium]|nr:enoyl-CoA hydratase/isomerase family protein [bacterium]